MSARVDGSLYLGDARPTRSGSRRRPPVREIEPKRPCSVYRAGLEMSFAKLSVLERLRSFGFSRTGS